MITVGSIHGGMKNNIIAEQVELGLTVRADNFEVRKQLLDGIDRVAAAPRGDGRTGAPAAGRHPLAHRDHAADDQPRADRADRPRRDRRAMGADR